MNKEVKYTKDEYEQLEMVEKVLQARILKLLRLLAVACPVKKIE